MRGHAGPPPEPRSEPQPRPIPLPQANGRLRAEPHAGATEPQAGATGEADPLAEAEARADAAELDALRGALVHELDRLAAAEDCSASFRRAG